MGWICQGSGQARDMSSGGALQVWPELGLHYAVVAKLAMADKRAVEGGAAAEAAADILHATLPASNRAIVEQVEWLRDLSRSIQQEPASWRRPGWEVGQQ